ncbi:MAG: hypothetical protein HYU48_00525 [Candidatus Levybacteria bacterium]|nr:hypothetical protein [Candidatus Levybacteria bacterium]
MTDTGKDRRTPIPEHLVQEGETMMAWFVNDFIANALPESEHVVPEKMASQMIEALPDWKTKTIRRLESTRGPLAKEHLALAKSFSFDDVVSYSDWQVGQLRKAEELEPDTEIKKGITKDIEGWWNIRIAANNAKNQTESSSHPTTSE